MFDQPMTDSQINRVWETLIALYEDQYNVKLTILEKKKKEYLEPEELKTS